MRFGSFIFGLSFSFSVHAGEFILSGDFPASTPEAQGETIKMLPHYGGRLVRLSDEQVAILRAQGAVLEPNDAIHLFDESAIASAEMSPPWYLDAVHAGEANKGPTPPGDGAPAPMLPVTVCVVDTGADVMAADLISAVSGGINIVTGADPKDLSDGVQHGTAVASLMVGRGVASVTGVAPGAMIYVVKVFDNKGVSSVADVAEGILSCIGNAQVINISFGTFTESTAIRTAIDRAVANGMTVIAAAGNESNDIAFPARYAPVIAVGAMTKELKIADFSGTGRELDFVAPGKDIPVLSPGGGVKVVSGTSYSAAIVSGIEALRKMRGKESLKARDLGFSSDVQGKGLVDALLTVQ